MSPKPPLRPIFFDPNGRRRYIVSAFNWGALSLAGVLITCLVLTSMAGPVLPTVKLTGTQRLLSASASPSPASSQEPVIDRDHARSPIASAANAATRYAHLITWDENSFSSLKRNARFLDVVIAEWLHLGGAEGGLTPHSPQNETLVRRWVSANAPDLKLYPLVNNYDTEGKRWNRQGTAEMLASERARARFVEELYRYVSAGAYPGLVLDLEQVPVASQADFTALVEELSDKLHGSGVKLLVQVPVSDAAYDYASLAAASDGLIVMTYDEHYEAGAPGPLAGQGWFEAKLDERFAAVDSGKLIVSVGSYAYNWAGAGSGREMSVQEAWELLAESGAKLRFDADSLNPTFTYVDESEANEHHVWYLDGVTGYNQVAAALAMRPAGLALWRLGTEDPGIWAAFGRGRMSDDVALDATKALEAGYDLSFRGKGEVLEVSGSHERGARNVSFDPQHNLITDQEIKVFPKSTTVTRWGARTDKVIALTFDDGPDPIYTPKILDVLAEKNVKGTFFVVGAAGVVNVDLLQRMYREGHDIGNHTFTHLNSAEASNEHIKFELNATQRLFEATIGARTRLFRPPYAADLEPQTIDGAEALRVSGRAGLPDHRHEHRPQGLVQAAAPADRPGHGRGRPQARGQRGAAARRRRRAHVHRRRSARDHRHAARGRLRVRDHS